jgi:phage terminase large subunit-like protein
VSTGEATHRRLAEIAARELSLAAQARDAERAEVEKLKADAAEKTKQRRDHPLAYAKLWHRDAPKTSQRTTAQNILTDAARFGFVFGGNRSGKSELGGQIATAFALGSDHPDVQVWAKNNNLDISVIPKTPGLVWSVALTFSDSKRYVREKLRRYAPVDTRFRSWEAENEAEAKYPNGGKIVCKAWAQGQPGMQGDSIRLLWSDEEPDDQFAWNEALVRLVDQNGRAITTMTPLHGMTWVHKRYVESPQDNVVSQWLHGEDNPHVPSEVLREMLSGFSEEEQAARARGEFTTFEGRIYSTFSRRLHVIPDMPIPPTWRRYRSIDFGTRNPFCCLWGAVDPDDRLHIYRVHYQAGWLLSAHAARIHELSGNPAAAKAIRDGLKPTTQAGEKFVATIADPEDAGGRKSLAEELGIPTSPAIKDVLDGIRLVQERLRPQVDGRPSLFVHASCVPLIAKAETYSWADNAKKDEPRKLNDHAMDALRYMVKFISIKKRPSWGDLA